MKTGRLHDSNFLHPSFINKISFHLSLLRNRLFRIIARRGIVISNNEKKLIALKNRHLGQRCFIVGNGPSLRIEDLDKLSQNGDITIASNKIFLAFKDTDWRPTYYSVADLLVAENNSTTINSLNLTKLFPDHFRSYFGCETRKKKHNGVHMYYRMLKQKYDNNNYLPYFSDDPLIGLHVGETVTNVNIQLAYYLGCNPIYLIGIDGKYRIPQKTSKHHIHGKVLISDGEKNHFHPDYHEKGESWCIPKTDAHECAFKYSKQFLESKGITILNASRETAVKAFDCIKLNTILNLPS